MEQQRLDNAIEALEKCLIQLDGDSTLLRDKFGVPSDAPSDGVETKDGYVAATLGSVRRSIDKALSELRGN